MAFYTFGFGVLGLMISKPITLYFLKLIILISAEPICPDAPVNKIFFFSFIIKCIQLVNNFNFFNWGISRL